VTVPERLATALADRYRIERELGQGGMATVFLAEDLKHKRKVAIKVLKPELAAVLGAERFVQEITTTAALQHPHILPLFDSGEADGFLFYVMPFIDGETLRTKLDRETQLDVDEAVKIATEVADALHYAHTQGVIHRDIKPENILLHNGRPMVADFGIALAVSAAAGGRMTETGLSLGTPHYMSPEQATAEREITARSDEYSLASVLYEMLSGNPPHTGASAQQIIMKIITEQAADLTALRKSVPLHVADAVGRALEKLPADRFASVDAFARALLDPTLGSGRTRVGTAANSTRQRREHSRTLPVLLGALLVTTALAAAGWLRPGADGRVTRLAVASSDGRDYGVPALSPNGSRYAYRSPTQGLLVRERDALVAQQIVDEGWAPFFSPDGDELGFATGFPGALKAVSLSTGSMRTIVADSVFGYGGSWGADGWIYYVGGAADARQLRRVRATGGATEVVALLDRAQGELFFHWPKILPGGKHLIVTVYPTRGEGVVMSVDLSSGKRTTLTPGIRAVYSPSGHLLVLRSDGTLAGARFEPKRAVITGPFVTLVDGVSVTAETETFFLSEDGTLTYRSAAPSEQVVRVTRDGAEQPIDADWTAPYVRHLGLSPDATLLAVALEVGGRTELWTKELPDGALSRLSYDGMLSYRPTWHARGRAILFASDRSGVPQLYSIPADASAPATLVRSDPRAIDEGEYSADGRWLAYRTGSGGARDVFVVSTGADTTPMPISASAYDEYAPTISPDGRAVAYVSNESGRAEVYVRPLPNAAAARLQVSADGGEGPTWSRDGQELFYRSASGDLISARLARDAAFRITARRKLFSMDGFSSDPRSRLIAVAPDNQSFYLVRRVAAGSQPSQVIMVLNWFEELNAKVP
jgi:eukaryotic-like serine/threonine-protein kinase